MTKVFVEQPLASPGSANNYLPNLRGFEAKTTPNYNLLSPYIIEFYSEWQHWDVGDVGRGDGDGDGDGVQGQEQEQEQEQEQNTWR